MLDKDHKPVHGLTAADFLIREDTTPQAIDAFSEVVLPDPVEPTAKWMRSALHDVTNNELHDSRIVVIVLDDAVIPQDVKMTAAAKAIARDVVNRLGPTDMASIVYTMNNKQKTQGFTTDKGRLLAAVEKFTPGFATFGIEADDYIFYQCSVNVVSDLADYLVALPQRPGKPWCISTGVPIDPAANAPMIAARNEGNATGSAVDQREEMLRLDQDLRDSFQRAQRANVGIYPIDPAGLNGVYDFALNRLLIKRVPAQTAEEADAQAGRAVAGFPAGARGQHGRPRHGEHERLHRRNHANLPRERVVLPAGISSDRSEGAWQVQPARRAAEGPSWTRGAGAQDQLHAKARAGARESLGGDDGAGWSVAEPRHADARERGADRQGRSILSSRTRRRRRHTATRRSPSCWGLMNPAPTERVIEHVDLLTRAFTVEGDPRGSQNQTADVTIRAATPAPGAPPPLARYEVLTEITLKPGRYELRLAVDNAAQAKTGSVFVNVDVPDFDHLPLSLSGVVLDSASAPYSAPRDALVAVMPIVPTTDRDFETGGQVNTFLRVYQGGRSPVAPVTLTTSILDEHDAKVFSSESTLEADRFAASRSADVTFPLPLDKLKPGVHLLLFEATSGKATARREVVFTVR